MIMTTTRISRVLSWPLFPSLPLSPHHPTLCRPFTITATLLPLAVVVALRNPNPSIRFPVVVVLQNPSHSLTPTPSIPFSQSIRLIPINPINPNDQIPTSSSICRDSPTAIRRSSFATACGKVRVWGEDGGRVGVETVVAMTEEVGAVGDELNLARECGRGGSPGGGGGFGGGAGGGAGDSSSEDGGVEGEAGGVEVGAGGFRRVVVFYSVWK
ncbi:hypothetical protein Droror1_Dr00007273 [Drosera rotundifolia]